MLLRLLAPLGAIFSMTFADLFFAPGNLFIKSLGITDTRLEKLGQKRHRGDRVGDHALLRIERARIIHRPLTDFYVSKADIDPGRLLLDLANHCTSRDITCMSRLLEVGDIEG